MDAKHAATSKTVLGNAALAIIVAVVPGASEFVAANPEIAAGVVSLLNILLRFGTKRPVKL